MNFNYSPWKLLPTLSRWRLMRGFIIIKGKHKQGGGLNVSAEEEEEKDNKQKQWKLCIIFWKPKACQKQRSDKNIDSTSEGSLKEFGLKTILENSCLALHKQSFRFKLSNWELAIKYKKFSNELFTHLFDKRGLPMRVPWPWCSGAWRVNNLI